MNGPNVRAKLPTLAGQVERGVRPAAEACPTCGSDCNERDELIKAEREIERLRADAMAALAAERARLRGYFRDALADTTITWPEEVAILYDKCFGLPSEPGDARHWACKAAS